MHPPTGTTLSKNPERFVPGIPAAISHDDSNGIVGKGHFGIGHILVWQPDHPAVGVGGNCFGLLTANIAKSVDPIDESVIFVAVAGNTNRNNL